MHVDLMLLLVSALSLDHERFPRRSKSWAKLLSISLSSSFRGHPGLANVVDWATFSRYFLLDTFSLACAIRIEVPRLH